ncbi:hypothetical protein OIO90_005326 [Microbotryomycetes sp. JL221]|nr:hypothetical protein OIO90_005326 [Microbotryomycetes sp. JL221]
MAPKGGSKGGKKGSSDDAGAGKQKGAQSLKIKHILCDKLGKADEAMAKLAAGDSFDKVAAAYSSDKVSLGWKSKGDVVPEFWQVAYDLPKSTSDKPVYKSVKTGFGYHVIMVEDRK